jgi:YbgC/YbaW family acyl-CoA thioester hydrolase
MDDRSEPPNGEPAEKGPDGPTEPTPASILVQRRIEWPDTDASGVYHNTAAFRFIEVAETALLERLGFLEEIYGRLPRAHVEADFSAPLRFRDMVDIHLRVAAVGTSSVTYEFEMRSGDQVAVTGRTVVVLLDGAGGRPTGWPEEYRRLLLTAGPQAPELLVRGE